MIIIIVFINIKNNYIQLNYLHDPNAVFQFIKYGMRVKGLEWSGTWIGYIIASRPYKCIIQEVSHRCYLSSVLCDELSLQLFDMN